MEESKFVGDIFEDQSLGLISPPRDPFGSRINPQGVPPGWNSGLRKALIVFLIACTIFILILPALIISHAAMTAPGKIDWDKQKAIAGIALRWVCTAVIPTGFAILVGLLIAYLPKVGSLEARVKSLEDNLRKIQNP